MTNGLKKEDSAALKGLAVLLLIFHHCYRLADRIERYQVDSGLLQLYPILFTLDLDLRIRASGEKPFMKKDSPYLQIYWESPDFWRLKVLTGHGGI